MRLFVRLSLIGLIALTAFGYFASQSQVSQEVKLDKVTLSQGVCLEDGISLVVDFGTKNQRPTLEKCIQGFLGYSWDLFEQAEIKVAGTEKYPVGFVCRIEDFPSIDQEKCLDTPGNSNGSWAYFLTDANGAWQYSPVGASTHKTKCGTSEGWRFLLPGEPVQTPPRLKPKSFNCVL
jgi:hypothetical protein